MERVSQEITIFIISELHILKRGTLPKSLIREAKNLNKRKDMSHNQHHHVIIVINTTIISVIVDHNPDLTYHCRLRANNDFLVQFKYFLGERFL